MKRVSLFVATIFVLTVTFAFAAGFKNLRANLHGFSEVPSVSTTATGKFEARINDDDSAIAYTLSYSDLEGAVTQAHIHFGQRGVNGNITVFLCTNVGGGPAGTQACPAPPATITGTITATDITGGAAGQGLAAGEAGVFAELIRAIRAGKTYANVHSAKFQAGEVRGQIRQGEGHGDHD
ncbi:MAG: CHRD domain-containing protein [Acidobacteriales bacterium]|nr:CHRD domain-containing protein [Terriglobales bacterium]